MDRVSTLGMNQTVIANTQQTLARLATYQEQLSTGKRINQPSDDPVEYLVENRRRRSEVEPDESRAACAEVVAR